MCLILFVLGIKIDAAAHQNAVYICHHAGHPAHVEVLFPSATRTCLAFSDVALDRRLPEAMVAGVNSIFSRVFRNPDIGLCEQKFIRITIERKAMCTFAGSQPQHGTW